jgi:hypothetical protein
MNKELLVGSWNLTNWKLILPNGQTIFPFGEDARGYAIFSEDGRVSGVMAKANRDKFASDFPNEEESELKVAAFDSFNSYCATYEMKGNLLKLSILLSSVPNWEGQIQERFIEKISEKELVLSAAPMPFNGMEVRPSISFSKA